MSGALVRSDIPQRPESHLRLVEGGTPGASCSAPREHDAPERGGASVAQVLVAGADTQARKRMLDELRDLLPSGTRFAQASETWEVIAGAPASSMVVLAGDLRDIPGGALMRLLGRRHPALPVLAVAEMTPTQTAADAGVARA